MLYIFDKVVNPEKKLQEILSSIYGINYYRILKICNKLGFNPLIKIKFLNSAQIFDLEKFVLKNFLIQDKLKICCKKVIDNQIHLKRYVGMRKIYGLPSKGQNTHSNARTSRKLKFF